MGDSDQPWDQWKCNEVTDQMVCSEPEPEVEARSLPSLGKIGWPSDGPIKASDLWCKINVPAADWRLKTCPGDGALSVKMISYNLFWWNLFSRHHGGGKSAGKLIARTSGDDLYDFMAYLKTRWTKLASGHEDVGEDSPNQYYGKRSVVWGRFEHQKTGKTVFFVNHHGPLKVSEGGGCTGSATALHIMKVIAENAEVKDAIVLSGDFNAVASSSRIQELSRRLNRVFTGHAIGGIDHIFTNCVKVLRDIFWERATESTEATTMRSAVSSTSKSPSLPFSASVNIGECRVPGQISVFRRSIFSA